MDNLKSIDFQGYKVDISLYKGRESLMLLHTLQERVLPSLATLFGAVDLSKGLDINTASFDLSVLQDGVATLFKTVGSDAAMYDLVKRILKGTTVYAKDEGGPMHRMGDDNDFDSFFMGRAELVYMLVLEVLKINYPFFLKSAGNLSGLMSRINSMSSQKQSKQTGTQQSATSESSGQTSQQAGRTSDFSVGAHIQKAT